MIYTRRMAEEGMDIIENFQSENFQFILNNFYHFFTRVFLTHPLHYYQIAYRLIAIITISRVGHPNTPTS